MIKKAVRIFLILAIILGFCVSYVFASDINLNLPGTDTDQTNNNNNNIDNTIQNTENSNDRNTQNDIIDDNNDTDASQIPEQLQPSAISSSPESGLNATNIINILLITVGVILILLAIAIIIRLK